MSRTRGVSQQEGTAMIEKSVFEHGKDDVASRARKRAKNRSMGTWGFAALALTFAVSSACSDPPPPVEQPTSGSGGTTATGGAGPTGGVSGTPAQGGASGAGAQGGTTPIGGTTMTGGSSGTSSGGTSGTSGVGPTGGSGGSMAGAPPTGGANPTGGSGGMAGAMPGGRGGSGGAAGGQGGTGGGSAGKGGTGGSSGCQKGQVMPAEVTFIGDSWVEIPGSQVTHLEELARAAGSLAQGARYNDRSVSGNTIAQIINQYRSNRNTKVLIMDGGGIDLIQSNNQSTVTRVISSITSFFQEVATDGNVDHIIYYLYPSIPGLSNVDFQQLRPGAEMACAQSTVPCHFLALAPIWNNSLIGGDNIHPSTAGGNLIAEKVWEIMQQNCIAQ
jgi:hypothetical protein